MKTRLFLLVLLTLLLLLTTAGSQPQPGVEEIVRRHVDAIGGKARWDKVEALVVRGEGVYSSFVWVWKRPGKMRSEEREPGSAGKTLIIAYDGSAGWTSNPFKGRSDPEALPAVEVQRWQRGVAIRSDLLDLPANARLELVGEEKIAGRRAYKLSLDHGPGQRLFLWIDAESFLLVQRERTVLAPWGDLRQVATPLRDYRNIDGIMIPHRIGDTRLVAEVNPAIDDALFRMPRPAR